MPFTILEYKIHRKLSLVVKDTHRSQPVLCAVIWAYFFISYYHPRFDDG